MMICPNEDMVYQCSGHGLDPLRRRLQLFLIKRSKRPEYVLCFNTLWGHYRLLLEVMILTFLSMIMFDVTESSQKCDCYKTKTYSEISSLFRYQYSEIELQF